MEEQTSDHEEPWSNEQSPLISPLGGTHDGGTHVGGTNDGGTHDGGTHEQSPGTNDPSKGFNFKRCMIIPMCACYFFAAGIYMYELPQYTQEVMKKRDDEKIVPHDIRPEYTLLYKSSGQSEHNACSSVNKSDPNYKKFITIQQDTAIWQIYFNVGSLLPAMFANLVWASYSDIIGRKFSIFLCLAGFFVRTLGFTVVIYFNLSLVYIVIANILDGLTGSFTSLFALLFSYVSDITFTGRQRTIAIVVVELVIGLAVTVSSLASGPLIQETGYFYPAFGVSCLNFLAIVILIFLVPETMQNVRVQRQRCSVVKSIGESLRFYFCDGSRVTRAKYCLLIFGFFFMGIPALSRLSIEVLYQLGRPFCWSATKIGWFGAIKMAFASLFGISGAYVLKRCLRDDTIAFGTLVLSAAALLVEGLAKTDFVLYSGKSYFL